MTEHRTMPHDLDAEQALLGAILLNNKIFLAVRYFLTPEEFALPAHGVTFEICRKLIERGETVDPAAVVRIADQDDKIAECEFFSELEDIGLGDIEEYRTGQPRSTGAVRSLYSQADEMPCRTSVFRGEKCEGRTPRSFPPPRQAPVSGSDPNCRQNPESQ